MAAFGLRGLDTELRARDVLLGQIAALPGTLEVDYHRLGNPAIARGLYEHCFQEDSFDLDLWGELDQVNIQVNMQDRLNQLHLNHGRIEALKADVLAQQGTLAWPSLH